MEEELKRIFVHIPKNGGTSVENSVPNIFSFGHDRWKDIPQEIRYIHTSYAMIRNPWARMVSRYIMGIPTSHTDNHGVQWKTFEEFLETRHVWINEHFDPIRSWNTQYDYVCDDNDIVRCDMLRLEHMNEELIPYLQLNTSFIARKNVGEYTKDYKDYYNEQTIQIVADWYAQDIDHWGFDFDTSATKNYHYEKEI